ncbi:hypothetical protein, partial [Oceaniovalibus sp. ACAM 378]|uniref:hypothetical protein n=1 Tax=Oceaniovalibus sp. ACAM 378 TaxID=2599923 RepID=UPI001CA37B03
LQIASQQHVTGVGAYPGIGGRIKAERVGASNRNRWAHHPGIRSLVEAERDTAITQVAERDAVIQDHIDTIAKLTDRAVTAERDLAGDRARAEAAEARAIKAEASVDAANKATSTADDRATKTQDRLDKTEIKLDDRQDRLDKMSADLGTARADLATSRAEAGQCAAKLRDAQALIAELRAAQ